MQYCDGGHNKDDQLLRAEQGRLATVTVDGTVYRAPSRTSIEHWLTDGERDRGRGENSLPAQLLEAFLHARIRSAHAAYDEILWLEQRMAMPKYRANPHYGQPDQPRNLENELYLEAGSATKLIQSKQWRLERLLPEMFGASMTVNQNVSGKIEMVAAAPGWVQKMIADKASTAIDVTPEGEKD